MEFTFGDMEKGGELTLGMHLKGNPFGIVNVDGCFLVDADFRQILDLTVRYFREKNFLLQNNAKNRIFKKSYS